MAHTRPEVTEAAKTINNFVEEQLIKLAKVVKENNLSISTKTAAELLGTTDSSVRTYLKGGGDLGVAWQKPGKVNGGYKLIAKDYGKSAKWLNSYLHEKGVQFKQGNVWLLYQKYAQQGYTNTKTHSYNGDDGEVHTKIHTYWTQKGRLFIYNLLKSEGILPNVEMNAA